MKILSRGNVRHFNIGFTLVEFFASMVVVAVFITICIPTYYHYRKQVYYEAVTLAAERYQTSVAACIQRYGNFTHCNAGENRIPPNITYDKGAVLSVTVKEGIITAVPRAAHGILATDIYVLTPKSVDGRIIWKATGKGCRQQFTQNC